MSVCGCVAEPPAFDLPPPPDPSLVWHLLTDERFQPAERCETNSLLSVADIIDVPGNSELQRNLVGGSLVAVAVCSILCLLAVLLCVARRIRRGRLTKATGKAVSSDAILVSGDNHWTYNSMKNMRNGSMGVLMYSNSSNAGSRFFHHTPATMRSYIGGGTPIMAPSGALRHSESTTLRLHPHDNSAAYHTVGRHQLPPSEHYEEIPALGTIGRGYYMTTGPPVRAMPMSTSTTTNGRTSIRKPPPSCRPPPPPPQERFSPPVSDCSLEKELTAASSTDSPPMRQWEDGGRESGYGTAPSLQWKSPSGSARGDVEANTSNRPPFVISAQTANPQSMTYV